MQQTIGSILHVWPLAETPGRVCQANKDNPKNHNQNHPKAQLLHWGLQQVHDQSTCWKSALPQLLQHLLCLMRGATSSTWLGLNRCVSGCRGANVAIHIASALQYLESHNIVHLDVKCAPDPFCLSLSLSSPLRALMSKDPIATSG